MPREILMFTLNLQGPETLDSKISEDEAPQPEPGSWNPWAWGLTGNDLVQSCIALLLHVNACASWCMVSKCVELVILPSRRLSSQLQGCLSSVLVLAGALTIMNCLVCKQFRNKEYWKDSPRTSSRAFRNIGNIIFQGTPRNCATKNTKPKDFRQTTFTEVCKRQHHKHKENTQSESRNAKTP